MTMVRLERRKIGSFGHLLLIKVDVEVVLRLQLPAELGREHLIGGALPRVDLLLFCFFGHRESFSKDLWNCLLHRRLNALNADSLRRPVSFRCGAGQKAVQWLQHEVPE